MVANKDWERKFDHVLKGPPYHCVFDNSIEPMAKVSPGETVLFHCLEATGGQYSRTSTAEAVKTMDMSRLHTITGPVYMVGAMPGDVLKVEILEFATGAWGWTSVEPGFGLLSDEFDVYELKIWTIENGQASFRPGISIPSAPFCGVMGVAPKEPGPIITLPPRPFGGNMDSRHMTVGAEVHFPVLVPGALLSIGDGHFAQGDGEVCGTAIECDISIAVRLSLIRGNPISSVRYLTPPPKISPIDAQGAFVTTAAGQDLQQLAHDAVSDMVRLLSETFEISRMDAYVVCSAAGSLKISVPVLGSKHAGFVTFHVPKAVFAKELYGSSPN